MERGIPRSIGTPNRKRNDTIYHSDLKFINCIFSVRRTLRNNENPRRHRRAKKMKGEES